MKHTLALLAALAAGCASWPGEDPAGRSLKAQATPVLDALVRYHHDHGSYPLSLYELAPAYLPSIPFAPGLHFDRESQVVQFSYEPSWPRTEPVLCFAHPGDTEWACRR